MLQRSIASAATSVAAAARRALDGLPHALERGVGVVDVSLLGRELRVGH